MTSLLDPEYRNHIYHDLTKFRCKLRRTSRYFRFSEEIMTEDLPKRRTIALEQQLIAVNFFQKRYIVFMHWESFDRGCCNWAYAFIVRHQLDLSCRQLPGRQKCQQLWPIEIFNQNINLFRQTWSHHTATICKHKLANINTWKTPSPKSSVCVRALTHEKIQRVQTNKLRWYRGKRFHQHGPGPTHGVYNQCILFS